MSDLQYAITPSCAVRIQEDHRKGKRTVIVSVPTSSSQRDSPVNTLPQSPTKPSFTNVLLSSALQLPSLPESSPHDGGRLLSTREPLSLPATTVNFRRFVARSGPVFWMQDRIEEIIMWRKGWKVTCAWMAIYSFLCYFPKLFLLVPHAILISILLATHDDQKHLVITAAAMSKSKLDTLTPKEASTEWFANLQGIQNLMAIVSDVYDAIVPLVPLLTWNSLYTHNLLNVAVISMVLLIPVVICVPVRPILLALGVVPLIITHPVSMRFLPTLIQSGAKAMHTATRTLVDDDNLLERHWDAEKRYIKLWENERWTATSGWSKSVLKANEKPWSGCSDEWGDVVKSDANSMTFALLPDWKFIETEDWRIDLNGASKAPEVDNNGWVYMDENWQHPSCHPLDNWKTLGTMARRRKWYRRIYRAQ